ncbi:uncharacterized protein LOC125679709 [Ostrea edulis]|uniref:uncharacterized protein LOC125679709 n=1 Tax=Ostrea edulis TaxID=37623 RepID=UPI0024AEA508|nr:uncharacterized protein LOC125679709 [Ostrea edulis]
MWSQCPVILLLFAVFTSHKTQAIKHQWASEVTNFSSQYNAGSYSAKQILGKPDMYPRYGGTKGSWIQATGQLNGHQFIEVKFRDKVFLTNVVIYETGNAGSVKRILAKDVQNRWIEIFWVLHAVLIQKARKFSPKIKVNFPVNELRIEVDCSVSRSYVYIDAVKIVGDDCPRQFKKYGDSCYMIKKDRVSADMAFANCLETGGYLANFETLEEAMSMKKILKKMNTGLHFYVGGRNINRRKPGGGDWRWIRNGKMMKMTYHAFGAGQPDGSDSSPQDCMFFYAGERYTFHDVYCDNGSYLGGYICEI